MLFAMGSICYAEKMWVRRGPFAEGIRMNDGNFRYHKNHSPCRWFSAVLMSLSVICTAHAQTAQQSLMFSLGLSGKWTVRKVE